MRLHLHEGAPHGGEEMSVKMDNFEEDSSSAVGSHLPIYITSETQITLLRNIDDTKESVSIAVGAVACALRDCRCNGNNKFSCTTG
jgi:hypothetical protein